MSIVVKNAKKHPDCEYCKAAEEIMRISTETNQKAVGKIKELMREISGKKEKDHQAFIDACDNEL